jgi:Mn2+/Fe2+ NRAMP family transporter
VFLFGGRSRRFLVARIAIIVAFLIILFAFHPHGTTLDVVQGVRVVLLVALVGAGFMARRRRRAAPATDRD